MRTLDGLSAGPGASIKVWESSPWQHNATVLLTRLFKSGFTASQMADRLNRDFKTSVTRNAVIGRLHRMGLKRGCSPSAVGALGHRGKKLRRSKPQASGVSPKPRPEFMIEPLPKCRVMPETLVALVDLEPHHCRWPYGEPKTAAFGFCGQPRISGPYCPACSSVAFKDPPAARLR